MVAVNGPAPSGSGLPVSAREVSHHFDIGGAPIQVLDRISLEVAAGEFIAILGPSGCGKSTLLRLFAGLEPPRAGTILAGDRPVLGADPSRILVFQDPTLFPWRSVWRNVALGLEARGLLAAQRQRVDDTLALVKLQDFAKALPHQLSGGMAQRVALARALINNPQILLFDEPLGKLDALTRMAMQGELMALWQRSGFTAVLVTHDTEEALLLASRVIVLSDRPARIVAEIAVDRPYPRRRDDPVLIELRQRLLGILGLGAAAELASLAADAA